MLSLVHQGRWMMMTSLSSPSNHGQTRHSLDVTVANTEFLGGNGGNVHQGDMDPDDTNIREDLMY
jgi:hypothetical protein